MRFARVELLAAAELPGNVAGISRWNTTLTGSHFAIEKAGDMLTVKHLETGKVLVYPWSGVRHAEQLEAPALAAVPLEARGGAEATVKPGAGVQKGRK